MTLAFPKSEVEVKELSEDKKELTEEEVWARPFFVEAKDGVPLATYRYLPKFDPDRVLIFYHDAGMYQCERYQSFAADLVKKYNIAVYLVEFRGHSFSGGRSAQGAESSMIYEDAQEVIKSVRARHKGASIYLGGHSQASAFVLNYAAKMKPKKISGYVLIAPYFGPFSRSSIWSRTKKGIKSPFKQLSYASFLLHTLSKGAWSKGKPAWSFNFNNSQMQNDPKSVKEYSIEMASCLNLLKPQEAFKNIKKPLFVLFPEKSHKVDTEVISYYFKTSRIPKSRLKYEVLAKSKDSTILEAAPSFISRQLALQTASV